MSSSLPANSVRPVRGSRGLLTMALVISLLGLTAVAANAQGATTTSTAQAPVSPYTYTKTETFGATGWWRTWGLTSAPWHTSLVAESGDQFLRVGFAAGSHNGTSFDLPTGTSDSARIQYRIRFSPNWQSNGGKLPGFGSPTYDANGVCLGGCGLAPADGVTSWTGRGHFNAQNILGSYLYVAGKSEWVLPWGNVPVVPGRWYSLEYTVKMNTPGQSDGVMTATIDGHQVFSATNLNLRSVPTLHVGKAWFGFYYGGDSVPPVNMWIDVDDITVDW